MRQVTGAGHRHVISCVMADYTCRPIRIVRSARRVVSKADWRLHEASVSHDEELLPAISAVFVDHPVILRCLPSMILTANKTSCHFMSSKLWRAF